RDWSSDVCSSDLEQEIDYLVLGCTHYPYLTPQIKKILPSHIQIIDSGKAVAQQTFKILQEKSLLNLSTEKGKAFFYTNSDKTVLQNLIGDEFQAEVVDF